MLRGMICSIVTCIVFLALPLFEAVANKRNATPRMHDGKNEERIIFRNIIKTREMFEVIKR